ncbi:aminotransferase [Zopfochytrium polystomum]|nr:aminotransferase [Zopfochytrium polystomum]
MSREPTPSIDWAKLGFSYRPAHSYIKYIWRDGAWDEGVLVSGSTELTLDIAATVFHYGQSCFEGMKAFRMADGRIRIFRPEINAKRLQLSCAAASMPFPPVETFLSALKRVVSDNLAYVPPLSSGGSLYIRPFVIGSGPQVALQPSGEYHFMIFVNPVTGFYDTGSGPTGVRAIVARDLDRAATHGTGHVKLGGNYAPVMASTTAAKARGFAVNLFLDSATHTCVEEFATSNFAGVKRDPADGTLVYVTPRSGSILKGVTNRSLAELASRVLGWRVERRAVPWDEVRRGEFLEVVAAGTAVVMTPISEIVRELPRQGKGATTKRLKADAGMVNGAYDWDADVSEDEDADGDSPGEESVRFGGFEHFGKLYKLYRAVQNGQHEGWEKLGWMWPAEGL